MDRRGFLGNSMLGLGGLTPRRPDQAYTPRGPGAIAPGAAAGTFRGRLVVVFGTGPGMGVFVYNGAPAAGNLIASITAGPGTDPYGNSYVGGITSYSASGDVELSSGKIFLFDSSNLWMTMSKAGLFVYQSPGGFGNLITSIAPLPGTDTYGNANLAGIVSYGSAGGTFFASRLAGGLAEIFTATSAAGPWTGRGQARYDTAVFGGGGGISLLSEAAAGAQLAVMDSGIFIAKGPISALNANTGAAEIWHQVGTAGEPAFQNGWANSGAGKGLAFTLNALNRVDVYGDLAVPGAPNTIVFTLPLAYRPSGTNEQIDVLIANQAGITRATVGVNGDVTVANMPAGATRVILKGIIYLDL